MDGGTHKQLPADSQEASPPIEVLAPLQRCLPINSALDCALAPCCDHTDYSCTEWSEQAVRDAVVVGIGQEVTARRRRRSPGGPRVRPCYAAPAWTRRRCSAGWQTARAAAPWSACWTRRRALQLWTPARPSGWRSPPPRRCVPSAVSLPTPHRLRSKCGPRAGVQCCQLCLPCLPAYLFALHYRNRHLALRLLLCATWHPPQPVLPLSSHRCCLPAAINQGNACFNGLKR